jgi:hypothetical protein
MLPWLRLEAGLWLQAVEEWLPELQLLALQALLRAQPFLVALQQLPKTPKNG